MRNGNMQSTTLMSQVKMNRRVLVLGHGLTAKSVVRELGQLGFQSLNLSLDESRSGRREETRDHEISVIPDSIEWPKSGRIIDFQGFPGAFRVGIACGERERRVEEVGAVVIAADSLLESTLGKWGLAPSGTVWLLSDFARRLQTTSDWLRSGPGEPRTVVFLCGFTHHSYPHTQRKAVECGLKLSAAPNIRIIFLLEHFKVAQEGMERMTRQARENGVLFVKLSRPGPRIQAVAEGLTVTYFDETLGEDLTVRPDLLVVEEACRPPVSAPPLANVLGVTLDSRRVFSGRPYPQPAHLHKPNGHLGRRDGQGTPITGRERRGSQGGRPGNTRSPRRRGSRSGAGPDRQKRGPLLPLFDLLPGMPASCHIPYRG